ncbi:hypothetical protein PYCC9005_002502 [Savitreella phatthalungensis]
MGLFSKDKDKDKDKGKLKVGHGSSTHSRSRSRSPLPDWAQSEAQIASINDISDAEAFAAAKVISTLEAQGLKYDLPRAVSMLRGKFCCGDATRCIILALALRDASDMILVETNELVYLQGAENVRGTTCYLDALLFAMYARSFPAFDALLYSTGGSNSRDSAHCMPGVEQLASDLRLFVNLLRSGQLVTTDIVDQLRSSIARCGWEDARSSQQQDTSECFGFVAEALGMPMLTFKVFIAHGGRVDADTDHKLVQERFLALSVPEPTDAQKRGLQPIAPIALVELIDSYFHTKLEVRRSINRQKSGQFDPSTFNGAVDGAANESAPSSSRAGHNDTELPSYAQSHGSHNPFNRLLHRGAAPREKSHTKIDSRGETTMPAWQMFELVPHYTPLDSSAQQRTLASQPPVVAICLKRYYFDATGTAVLNHTPVAIPEYIDFAPFTDAETLRSHDASTQSAANAYTQRRREVRLRLESAVCHRGRHVGSGHYVAICRGNSHPGQWLLFDDLSPQRVTQGDFSLLFGSEIPYLPFYQLEVADTVLTPPSQYSLHQPQQQRPSSRNPYGAMTAMPAPGRASEHIRGASFYAGGDAADDLPPVVPRHTRPITTLPHTDSAATIVVHQAPTRHHEYDFAQPLHTPHFETAVPYTFPANNTTPLPLEAEATVSDQKRASVPQIHVETPIEDESTEEARLFADEGALVDARRGSVASVASKASSSGGRGARGRSGRKPESGVIDVLANDLSRIDVADTTTTKTAGGFFSKLKHSPVPNNKQPSSTATVQSGSNEDTATSTPSTHPQQLARPPILQFGGGDH